MKLGAVVGGVGSVPLLKTARHSSSLFCTGYDMFLSEVELELKREPRKGIVGMDFRIVPRAKGCSARARCAAGTV